MSIDISVSSKEQVNCNNIIQKLLNTGINCRIIETTSIINNNIEKGCLITLGKEYKNPTLLKKVWDNINSEYICSHIKTDDSFNGCLFDYLGHENGLIRKSLKDETTKCPHSL